MVVFNIFLMISNYFHDLATALLAANIVVIYLLGKYLDSHPQQDVIIANLFNKLKYVTYGAFAWVILGGIPRAIFFIEFEWNPAVGKGQVTALIIKHIILVSLTIFGLIVHRRYVKKYGHA